MTERNEFNEKRIEEKAELLKSSIRDFRRIYNEKSLQIMIFGEGFPKNSECWDNLSSECNSCLKKQCIYPKLRITLRDELEKEGDSVIFPEQLELINPSLDEEMFLKVCVDEIELIIILPVSFGSVDEFSTYSRMEEFALKMRVFVEKQYHPLYTSEQALLIDSYLRFLTKYGHVYPYKDEEELIRIIKILINS